MTETTEWFLPKDRDTALFCIKHELYHRLLETQHRISLQDLQPSTPDTINLEMHLRNEERWLRGQLDLIERS